MHALCARPLTREKSVYIRARSSTSWFDLQLLIRRQRYGRDHGGQAQSWREGAAQCVTGRKAVPGGEPQASKALS